MTKPGPAAAKGEALERLMELRDEFVRLASQGRYCGAASKEWRELPANWRMALLMLAGIGMDADDLETLASRDWREFPEPERRELQAVIRTGKRSLARVTALAAKV